MNPRLFALIAGIGLLVLAFAEFSVRAHGSPFVAYASGLFMFHVTSGLLGVSSLANRGRWTRWFALAIGVTASFVALAGFIPTGSSTVAAAIFGVSLPMVELVVHLVVGVGGLFAGLGGSRE